MKLLIELEVPEFVELTALAEELQEAIDEQGVMDDSQLKEATILNFKVHPTQG